MPGWGRGLSWGGIPKGAGGLVAAGGRLLVVDRRAPAGGGLLWAALLWAALLWAALLASDVQCEKVQLSKASFSAITTLLVPSFQVTMEAWRLLLYLIHRPTDEL